MKSIRLNNFHSSKVIAIAFLLLGITACGPPDTTKPGTDGGSVPKRTIIDKDVVITNDPFHVFSDDKQTVLKCGKAYHLWVQTTEPVKSCEGVNYSGIYQKALSQTRPQTQQIICEEGCQKETVETYHAFSCAENKATVGRKLTLLCLKEGDVKPPGTVPVHPMGGPELKVSTETIAPGETDKFDPPPEDGELVIEQLKTDQTTYDVKDCPGLLTFSLRYNEKDPGQCLAIGDYKPYIDHALKRARERYLDNYACQRGCTKAQDVKVLRTEWTCDAKTGMVMVKLVFQIVCEKTP